MHTTVYFHPNTEVSRVNDLSLFHHILTFLGYVVPETDTVLKNKHLKVAITERNVGKVKLFKIQKIDSNVSHDSGIISSGFSVVS